MKKVLIGNGGHAREVMAQMGVNLLRFVDDEYVDKDTLPLSQFVTVLSISPGINNILFCFYSSVAVGNQLTFNNS